jgi:vacuolar-type H+-ATPase subunit H
MSGSKQRTTTSKRVREARLRERRLEKQAKKDARKLARAHDLDALTDPADPSPEDAGDAASEAD